MPPKKSKKPKRRVIHANDEKIAQRAEEGEGYAQVTKKLGNGRIMVNALELDKEILCHIRGNIRGLEYKSITLHSFVLISYRSLNNEYKRWQECKQKGLSTDGIKIIGDVISVYSERDIYYLRELGDYDPESKEAKQLCTQDEENIFKNDSDVFETLVNNLAQEKKTLPSQEEGIDDGDIEISEKTQLTMDEIIDLI